MVLMNDFKADPEKLIQQQLAAVEKVVRSGWFVLGKELEQFENRWAQFCGTRFAVGVANGMDAIEIGLRSLGIGPGDEVITTPMTAFATVLAILRAGATPVLADIHPGTALLDLQSVQRCLSRSTKAVVLVHLYGQVREMNQWQEFCRAHDLFLIEDCAQSHEAGWEGRKSGTFGAFGAYSFYPTKNLGALGDGGAIVTSLENVATMARVLRNYGQSKRYYHPEQGLNSRLDEVQAAILSVRLEWLSGFNNRRREVAACYFRGINHPKVKLLLPPVQPENHVYHLFVLLCQEREQLMKHLKDQGIETLIHYPVPVHLQEPCKHLKRDPAGLQAAEKHSECCLSMPCHPHLKGHEINQVIEAINGFK